MKRLGGSECTPKEDMMMQFVHRERTSSYRPIPENYGMRCISRSFLCISRLVDPFVCTDAELRRMAEKRNVAMMNDFEAVMTPKAKLGKGMAIGGQNASETDVSAKTERKPDGHSWLLTSFEPGRRCSMPKMANN